MLYFEYHQNVNHKIKWGGGYLGKEYLIHWT